MVRQPGQAVLDVAPPEHIVQLFDGPESLGESVAAFLRAGLDAGGRLLMVAKASSVRQISTVLERSGVSVAALVRDERLTILDAHATLRDVMRGGCPDARLFDTRIADLVLQLAAEGHPLYVYGELVELLAEEGNFQAAADLEDLWNRLGEMAAFSLLCGYSSAHFAAPYAGAALRHICERHTRVHQSHGDVLANWLLRGRSQRGSASPDAPQAS